MVPSGLLIAALLAATPLIALGGLHSMLPALGLGIMTALVMGAVIDGLLSGARDGVNVERRVPRVLSLGAEEPVTIAVTNRTGRRLRLLVKDDPPAGFAVPERTRRITLDSRERGAVGYRVTARERGDHDFGAIHLRGLSRLRLVWWQRRVEAPETVRVYPNLRQIHEFDALARRGRMEEIGLRAARPRGEGTEFESLRDYVPDDSFRSIDWKATARRGSPITRQYLTERNQTVLLLIDSGRMMAARSGEMARIDHAANAALMLAHVAGRMGDMVGLLTFSDRVKTFIAPAHSSLQADRLVRELYDLQAELVEPDYRAAVGFVRARARKRALVCAFTDLVDPEVSREALACLASLRPRHLPMVVTMTDPAIEAIADAMPAHSAAAYEKAVAQRTQGERSLALARLRSHGALTCDGAPDDLTGRVISQYLAIKRGGLL